MMIQQYFGFMFFYDCNNLPFFKTFYELNNFISIHVQNIKYLIGTIVKILQDKDPI